MAASSRVLLKSSLPFVLNQYLPEQQPESALDDSVTVHNVVTSPEKDDGGGDNDPTNNTEATSSDAVVDAADEEEDKEEEDGGDGEDDQGEATQTEKPRVAKSVRLAAAENHRSSRKSGQGPGPGPGPGSKGGVRAANTRGWRNPPSQARHGGSHPPPYPPRRELTGLSVASSSSRSGLRRREAEAERLEHVADVWDQARSEVLSERHVRLQEKVALQQRLLRAQDLHASQIRQQREEQEALKRKEEKEKRQSKEAALQDICKQSLDADKQKASLQREGGGGTGRAAAGGGIGSGTTGRRSADAISCPTTPSSHSSHNSGDGCGTKTPNDTGSSDSADSKGGGRAAAGPGGQPEISKGPSRRHRGYRPSQGLSEYQLPSTPMRELEDEGEESSWGGQGLRQGSGSGKAGREKMPSHHVQLYELYGKQADYFLHPKLVPEAQPQRRPTHPKLRSHQVLVTDAESGHIGAGELWDTLRKDSKSKLIRNDMRFPRELKSAFGAFVRERLTQHVRPVERSFCATEDVPDINRLMDQSKLRNTRMYRHKTELMYRSSVTNMDRTSILLHNNPMPDITGAAGHADSISRYLPSWMDTVSEMSEPEYMKWINARKDAIEEEEEDGDTEDKENVRHSAHSRQLSETTNELHNIWHAIAARKKKPRTPRYQFLTEKDAETEGAFTQRFQEEKEQREKPQPHHVTKSHSALDFSFPTSAYSVPPSRERGRSAMQLQRYQSDWQPLSMTALVEYKKQVETEGQGDFDHGCVKMWPAVTSSVA